jgi:hypothetical protein
VNLALIAAVKDYVKAKMEELYMKKFLAGILAVTLTMSVTACGSKNDNPKLNNSEDVSSQIANVVSSDTEITTDKDENTSEATNKISESNAEEILKQIISQKIEAVQNDDFDTFYAFVPSEFWIKFDIAEGDYTEDEVTNDKIAEYDEYVLNEVQEEFDDLQQTIKANNVTNEIYDFEITSFELYDENTGLSEVNAQFVLKGNYTDIPCTVTAYAVNNEWLTEIEIDNNSDYEDSNSSDKVEILSDEDAQAYARNVFTTAQNIAQNAELTGNKISDGVYSNGSDIVLQIESLLSYVCDVYYEVGFTDGAPDSVYIESNNGYSAEYPM